MTAPKALSELVDHFRENRTLFRGKQYNETQIRREFIDPMFELLGWDLQNRGRQAEAYKDVIHEDAIRIAGTIKAPDYAFRIGGTRKFFLEAKKPSVNIKDDASPAFQLRRYAWSAKLPLSILTDFEEFAVYDCRFQPKNTDLPDKARRSYFTYEEYEARWDEIVADFSRNAVLHGSIERIAEQSKRQRGTTEVDEAFLAEIEKWRANLARNIALRNSGLSVRDLNTAVQQIIDRLIFLRIAEDRGIEQYGSLQALKDERDPYAQLCKLFLKADDRYNSGLFHFEKSSDVSDAVDSVTLGLSVDGKVIKDIVEAIYYPDSPYEFSVLGADLLGQVYEQFLGKVINLSGKRAAVVDKPDVKKAGGVYYTPTYIVKHLVSSVLNPLLQGKSPSQVSGSDGRSKTTEPLRVIDPACGSGSFLIEAYQQLLDWHLDWYVANDPVKHSRGKDPKVYQTDGGGWRLSIAERRRILLTHIFGVDLDSQAVEVTKLSLCLKVLEGETKDAIARQMDLFNTRALPDLHENIKWGNSLVSTDAYEVLPQMLFSDEADIIAMHPFNWSDAFIFLKQGARFDGIIGNPPYLPIFQMRKDLLPYYQAIYSTYQKRFDAYALFLEMIVKRLMGPASRVGLIIPSSLLHNTAFSKTRALLSANANVEEIIVLGGKVFKRVNKDTMTICARGSGSSPLRIQQHSASTSGFGPAIAEEILAPQSAISERGIALHSESQIGLLDNIASEITLPLGSVADTFQGIVTGADDVFIADRFTVDAADRKLIKPFLFGSDISQYRSPDAEGKIAYVTKHVRIGPKLEALLRPAKARLKTRRETLTGKIPWFALHWPRNKAIFEQPKILVQGIRNLSLRKRIVATIDEGGYYAGVNLNIVNLKSNSPVSLDYIVAILNSRVVNFWFAHTFIDHRIKNSQLEAVPVPVGGQKFEAYAKELETKVGELREAIRNEDARSDATAQLWKARGNAAREAIELIVEDLFELDAAARETIRGAYCNGGARMAAA